MGNLKYFSLLIAAGMFAACSDNLENAGNGNEGDTLTGEKGYVNIGINLPTTNGSSRAYTDNFHDGEKAEYEVNDVIIALFYGANEASATCKHAFQISGAQFIESSPTDDNITTYSVSGVRMISDPDPGQKVYALALINAPSGIFQVTAPTNNKSDEDAGNSVLTSKLKFNSVEVSTLSDITAVAAEYITPTVGGAGGTVGTKYYFMSNAPLAVSGAAQTLAPITVYKDKEEAAAGAAFNPIYVERAAAKVVVNIKDGGSNDNTLTIDGTKYPHYDGATVKFTNWTLQNTNKTFFPIRNVNDFSKWYGYDNARFISTGDISGNSGKRRIYWAIDNNYETKTETNSDIFDNLKTEPTTAIGVCEYCPENTTTAENMTDDKLTSVLLKSTFIPKGATGASNFFMIGDIDAVYSETEFVDWATKVLAKSGVDGVPLGSSEEITLNGSLPTTTGTVATDKAGLLTLLNIPGATEDDGIQEKRISALLTAANSSIKFYKGGVTYYYATAIKHFGDDETPAPADGISYNENDHLGRFGVVRNTWYEITINSVSGPGEPTIPEIPVTPPDKKQSYINCEINVLSWAKRSQGVDL